MAVAAALTGLVAQYSPTVKAPASDVALSRPISLTSRGTSRWDRPDPTTTAAPVPPPAIRHSDVIGVRVASAGGGWAALINCESGGHNDNTGNGFYGFFQFDAGTFRSVTGLPGVASDYSYDVQLAAAEKLYAERGAEPWPVCGRFL